MRHSGGEHGQQCVRRAGLAKLRSIALALERWILPTDDLDVHDLILTWEAPPGGVSFLSEVP